MHPILSLSKERREEVKARLDKLTTKGGPDDCWLYEEDLNNKGYGRIGITTAEGRVYRTAAHRAIWVLYYEIPIPKELFCCHSCDVRNCVNPKHVFLGNNQINVQDMMLKGRHLNKKKGHSNAATTKTTYTLHGKANKV